MVVITTISDFQRKFVFKLLLSSSHMIHVGINSNNRTNTVKEPPILVVLLTTCRIQWGSPVFTKDPCKYPWRWEVQRCTLFSLNEWRAPGSFWLIYLYCLCLSINTILLIILYHQDPRMRTLTVILKQGCRDIEKIASAPFQAFVCLKNHDKIQVNVWSQP